MLIGELSKKTGLSRDTIRFYEKKGFIKIGRRERRVNNYKEYSDATFRRLMLFVKLKSYGFTLTECAEIISLMEADLATCDRVAKMTDSRIDMIDAKILELTKWRNLLRSSIDDCNNGRYGAKNEDANCPMFALD